MSRRGPDDRPFDHRSSRRALALRAAVALGVTIAGFVVLHPDDLVLVDTALRGWTGRSAPRTDVAIVDVGTAVRDRESLARAVGIVSRLRPASIGLDVALDEPREPTADATLAEAIAEAGRSHVRVVVAVEAAPAGSAGARVLRPAPAFAAIPDDDLGVANLIEDAHGAARTVVGVAMDRDRRLLGFAAALVRARPGERPSLRLGASPDALEIDDAGHPHDVSLRHDLATVGIEGRVFDVAFGPPGSVPVVSLRELEDLAAAGSPAAGRLVTGRVVLLGHASAPRNTDLWRVPPLAETSSVPGVLVHAHAVASLLDGRSVRRPGGVARWSLAALVAAVGAFAAARARSRLRASAALAGIAFLGVVAIAVGIVRFDTYVPAWSLLVPLVVVALLDGAARSRAERAVVLRYLVAASRPVADGPQDPPLGEDLPSPLLHARAYARSVRDGAERALALIDVGEVTIRYLAAIAVADALRVSPGDVRLTGFVPRLRAPGLGTWVELLRTGATVVGEDPGRAAAPSLAAAWTNDPELRGLCDRLTRLRNEEFGHAARRADALVEVAPVLSTDVDRLLGRLAFLRELPLVEVREVRGAAGTWTVEGALRTGLAPTPALTEFTCAEAVGTGTLAVRHRHTGALLPLEPFAALLSCTSHRAVELAFLNGFTDSGKPKYLCYDTGCKNRELESSPMQNERARPWSGALSLVLAATLALAAGCGESPRDATVTGPYVVLSAPGKATARRAEGADRALAAAAELQAGDEVVPGSEPVRILGPDGGIVVVTVPTRLGRAPERAGLTDAVLRGLVERVRGLDGPGASTSAGASRSGGEVVPLFPRSAIREGRPTFRWRLPPGVPSVRVRLVRMDPEPREVVATEVSGASWEWPSDRPPLEPGHYRFHVGRPDEPAGLPPKDGWVEPIRWPWFTVLSTARCAEIDRRSREFEAQIGRAPAELRRVLRAAFLESEGVLLRQEALAEYDRALEEAPGDALVVRLRASLLGRLGLAE